MMFLLGSLLVAGMTISVGQTVATGRGEVAQRSSVSASLGAAPLDESSIVECSQNLSDDPVAFECEDTEVEGRGSPPEPTDEPLTAAMSAQRLPRGSGTLLVGRDAVAGHAARGPPIA
ncbi:MAG: hypothetical protein AB7S26_34620 [Sandaracinaceae bacterium]